MKARTNKIIYIEKLLMVETKEDLIIFGTFTQQLTILFIETEA